MDINIQKSIIINITIEPLTVDINSVITVINFIDVKHADQQLFNG